MTKEQAIKFANCLKNNYTIDFNDMADFCDMAIKALEQQPSEDCVSLAKVFEIMGNLMSIPYDFDRRITEKDVSESMDEIRALPPVTPTRKVGKWINKSHKSGCGILFVASECTCCRNKTLFNCDELLYNYCPNCGSLMKED